MTADIDHDMQETVKWELMFVVDGDEQTNEVTAKCHCRFPLCYSHVCFFLFYSFHPFTEAFPLINSIKRKFEFC